MNFPEKKLLGASTERAISSWDSCSGRQSGITGYHRYTDLKRTSLNKTSTMFTTMKYILVLIMLMFYSHKLRVIDATTTQDTGPTQSASDTTGTTDSTVLPAIETGSTEPSTSDTLSTTSDTGSVDTASSTESPASATSSSANTDSQAVTGSPTSASDTSSTVSQNGDNMSSGITPSVEVTGSTDSSAGGTGSTEPQTISCYNGTCSSEDCLEAVEVFCDMPENGACFISKMGSEYSGGCRESTCEWNEMTASTGQAKTTNCCSTDKCNSNVDLLNAGNYVTTSILALVISCSLHLLW